MVDRILPIVVPINPTPENRAARPVFGTVDGEGQTLGLDRIVTQAVGAASACWDNLQGAGVFREDRARQIVDELMEIIDDYVEFVSTQKPATT